MMQAVVIIVLTLQSVVYCQSTSSLGKIKNAIPSTPVVLVSKSYCPYSLRAKYILESYGVDDSKMKIFNIEREPNMNEIQSYMSQITGDSTVPRIFIDGQFLGGAEELATLHYSQKLEQILSKAGAL